MLLWIYIAYGQINNNYYLFAIAHQITTTINNHIALHEIPGDPTHRQFVELESFDFNHYMHTILLGHITCLSTYPLSIYHPTTGSISRTRSFSIHL